MTEPALKYCTVREGDSEWHLECRFSDGQKYAAIKIDGACPELATRVAALLNGNVWTEDRPTEPGEYWLGLKPSSRAGILPTKGYPLAVTMFLHSGDLCVGINGVAFGMEARCFDGAKWSRRETPADPFDTEADAIEKAATKAHAEPA